MKTFATIPILTTALMLSACDVFLDDIGHLGEPCAFDGECYGDLICIHGTCSETPGDGEECNEYSSAVDEACEDGFWCINGQCAEAGGTGQPCLPNSLFGCTEQCEDGAYCVNEMCVAMGGENESCYCYDYYGCPGECDEYADEEDFVCDDGVGCVDNVCVGPSPETVAQPNSSKIWLRCPVGMEWDGWHCTGTAEELLWDDALEACPDGFNIPSVVTFTTILANCDDYLLSLPESGGGTCDPCSESPSCDAMFSDDYTSASSTTDLPIGPINQRSYWTSTVAQEIAGYEFAFIIRLGGGNGTLDTSSNVSLTKEPALCVQY